MMAMIKQIPQNSSFVNIKCVTVNDFLCWLIQGGGVVGRRFICASIGIFISGIFTLWREITY